MVLSLVGFPLLAFSTTRRSKAIESVEEAFKALAKGKVDVPMPMHIGIDESDAAGPGDCHIKGGCKYLLVMRI